MIFPYRSLLLAIWICWSGFICLAQSPAKGFHWDWHKVEKDNWESIAQSKALSAKERAGLIEAVASQLRPFMSNLGIESEQGLREAAAKTRIKAVDLGGKSAGEFAAQGVGVGPTPPRLCSPTGNCEFWVFRQNGDKYSVILHRTATQSFTIQPTITNGFHDLVLNQHGSAFEQGLTLYRFDGSRYRFVACYDANWEILGKDGEVHDLKEPRITPYSEVSSPTPCLME
ncbi:MAG TPA: hypothetical protein VK302_18450 [Terriglobales bacterium]|nr:hypothetical protein [Terriglobales bacterium]